MSSSLEKHQHRRFGPRGIAVCLAAAALLPGCGGGKTEAKSAPQVQAAQPAPSVVVAPVVQKTVPIFSELTARTDASDSVEIRARVKAFLLKQSYAEGTMVRAGQVLLHDSTTANMKPN